MAKYKVFRTVLIKLELKKGVVIEANSLDEAKKKIQNYLVQDANKQVTKKVIVLGEVN
jgi:hypothetical protein